MTMTRPCRRMILHFSHIFLTLGRTFITIPCWKGPGRTTRTQGAQGPTPEPGQVGHGSTPDQAGPSPDGLARSRSGRHGGLQVQDRENPRSGGPRMSPQFTIGSIAPDHALPSRGLPPRP